ncbi:MAG: leucyl aminopeptidase [Acidobacteriota bacterium]
MKIELGPNRLEEIATDALVVPIFKGETTEQGLLQRLNELTDGIIASILEAREMKGNRAELVYVHTGGRLKVARLILVGAGEREKFTHLILGQLAGAVVRMMRNKRVSRATMLVRSESLDCGLAARLITENAQLALYEQDKYQHKEAGDERFIPEQLALAFLDNTAPDRTAIEPNITRGMVVAEATNFTRDLCVEPGNTLTPIKFAERAEEIASQVGLEFEVIDEAKLKQLGMGALLAVARGSEEPPQMIILRYRAAGVTNTGRPIALVGKGITFDSGGICIKPRDGMWEMKMDMAGGATVIGTLAAIARLKPAIDVIGIVPASENLPSGKAYKPGDVLHAYSGKTIEVIDTDAEGRLILADALHYATQQNPACIIDLATLTGACIVALGSLRAAIIGTDEALVKELRAASERAGEKLWPLPLTEEYREMIKSDIADIKNLGGRYAGTITAAAFLREFVDELPWVHLDIAGTAWQEEDKPESAKGPTGFGVRTLVEFILARAANS